MSLTEEEAPTMRPLSLWKNRNYLLFWGGQAISSTGGHISEIAFPLLLLAVTRSPIETGIAGSLSIIPAALLGIVAGALVDRWDRRKTMILCDIFRAINMASIPIAGIAGILTPIQLFANALIEGTLVTFFFAAQKAYLRTLVPIEQLPVAVAQDEVAEGLYLLGGPPLGGLLFSLRASLPFLVDAISYCVSVITLSLIKLPSKETVTIEKRHLLDEIRIGARWLFHQPLILTMTFFYTGCALLSPGYSLLLIVLLYSVHASNAVVGVIFGIGGVGSILGALIAPFAQKRWSFGQAQIGVRWLICLSWFLFAFAPNPFWIGIVLFIFLFLEPTEDVVYFSYRLALIPEHLQGRVISIARIFTRSASSVAPFLVGFFIDRFGVLNAVLICGVHLGLMALILTFSPHVRKAPPLRSLTDQ
ncbi:MAG TPA: MFS transporter [Ktedonobacteraceae bacterium]|nr:MFS transporter [Ktedonobacteraceae bacterium]